MTAVRTAAERKATGGGGLLVVPVHPKAKSWIARLSAGHSRFGEGVYEYLPSARKTATANGPAHAADARMVLHKSGGEAWAWLDDGVYVATFPALESGELVADASSRKGYAVRRMGIAVRGGDVAAMPLDEARKLAGIAAGPAASIAPQGGLRLS